MHWIDEGGAMKRAYGPFTQPVDDSTSDGHDSDSEDLYLGGGETLYTLVGFHFNYLVCRPDNGFGPTDIVVALEPQLRDTIASETIGGEGWDYDSYDATDQSRDATYGTTVEHQFITPRFLPGNRIPVRRCVNTGLAASGTRGLYVEWAGVAVAGAGYTVDDVLTVSGGTGAAATLTVTEVHDGAIIAVEIATSGDYEVPPSLTAAVTGGTGDGAFVNLTISAACKHISITGRQWAKAYEVPA
jgi:hypothetical protein